MSNLHFLHFDTSFRNNPQDDPFNCTLQLANPLRNVKKIYLKSCEIPLGFLNVRDANEFSFTIFQHTMDVDMTFNDYTFMPVFYNIKLVSKPNVQNIYFAEDSNPDRTITTEAPFTHTEEVYSFPLTYKITVPAGNFGIDDLIKYINDEIAELNKQLSSVYKINTNLGELPFYLKKMTLNDSGAFPVGFVRLYSYLLTNAMLQIISTNHLTNTILGFSNLQIGNVRFKHITAPKLWGIYNDLAIHLYFPNIPHNNTHFGSQLLSFKIPMSSGYQAISFTADSHNFSQYITLSDPNFILNTLKLAVYDTRGNPLVNQYNWQFTLGFET